MCPLKRTLTKLLRFASRGQRKRCKHLEVVAGEEMYGRGIGAQRRRDREHLHSFVELRIQFRVFALHLEGSFEKEKTVRGFKSAEFATLSNSPRRFFSTLFFSFSSGSVEIVSRTARRLPSTIPQSRESPREECPMAPRFKRKESDTLTVIGVAIDS